MAGNLAQPIATDKADAWMAFVSATLNTVVWTVRKVFAHYFVVVMGYTVEASVIVHLVGKDLNVTSESASAWLLIALDMDNVEKEFAFVTQDGQESIVKHEIV